MASSVKTESTMRGCIIAGLALLCVIGTGCPHDWMKDGTNDRAMRKDTKEELEYLQASMPCPKGQSRKEVCEENAEEEWVCKWICQ
jgi:hypothetical protein